MKKILLGIGIVAASVTISLPLFAHGEWYIGAGLNHDSQIDLRVQNGATNAPHGYEDYDFHDSDIGYDVYGGYSMNKWFAIELGYTNLGDVEFKEQVTTDPDRFQVKDAWRSYLVAVGRLPVNENVKMFGRAGAAYYSSQQKDTIVDGGTTTSRDDVDGFAFMYGAGIEYGMDEWAFRVDYTGLVPQDNSEHDDVYFADVIGLSFQWWFGSYQ